MAARPPLAAYHRALLKRFGPQHWWPADSPFEVMVGAILTQNAAWTNVEKAILNLKAARLLDPRRILRIDRAVLAQALRPSGYFNVKERRLRDFARWFLDRFDGDVDRMRRAPTDRLREELLSVRGIGRETADSILLYALGHPVFVIDAYTHRVVKRHGLAPGSADYEALKELFESTLAPDAALYNEAHALLVAVGKEYCRPAPKCDACPLRRRLPRKGPILPARGQKENPSARRRRGSR